MKRTFLITILFGLLILSGCSFINNKKEDVLVSLDSEKLNTRSQSIDSEKVEERINEKKDSLKKGKIATEEANINWFRNRQRIDSKKYYESNIVEKIENPNNLLSPEYSHESYNAGKVNEMSEYEKDKCVEEIAGDCFKELGDLGFKQEGYIIKSYQVGIISIPKLNIIKEELVYSSIGDFGMFSTSEIHPVFQIGNKIYDIKINEIQSGDLLENFLLNFKERYANNSIAIQPTGAFVEEFPLKEIVFDNEIYEMLPGFMISGCVEGGSLGDYFFEDLFDNQCRFAKQIGTLDNFNVFEIRPRDTYEIEKNPGEYGRIRILETGETFRGGEYNGCYLSCYDYFQNIFIKGNENLMYVYKPIKK